MPKITLRAKNKDVLIKRGTEHLRAKVPQIATKRFKLAAEELQRRLNKPGKKVRRPLNWDSEKQKLFVIITLRKQKRLPYERTGQNAMGWKVKAIKTGFTVSNRRKAAVYIWGDANGQKQSRIHQKRWPLARDEAEKVIKALPAVMQREMVELAKRIPDK